MSKQRNEEFWNDERIKADQRGKDNWAPVPPELAKRIDAAIGSPETYPGRDHYLISSGRRSSVLQYDSSIAAW
jgi:hypothetical protein